MSPIVSMLNSGVRGRVRASTVAPPAWAANLPSGLTLYSDISWDDPLGGTTVTNGWANAGNNGGFTRVAYSTGGFGPWAIRCTSPAGWTGNGDDMGRIYTPDGLNWRGFYVSLRHEFSSTYACNDKAEKFLYPGLTSAVGQQPILNVSRRDGDVFGFCYLPYQNPPGEQFIQDIGPPCLLRGVPQNIDSFWWLNTPNQNDGILRVWVDGIQVVNVTNWRAYQGDVQALVNFFRYDTTSGGGTSAFPAPAEGNSRTIDRIALYGAPA